MRDPRPIPFLCTIAALIAIFMSPAICQAVTTAEDASGGCDGVKTGAWGFHVASKETNPWWQVDLGREVRLDRVVIFNRADGCASRTAKIKILVAGSDGDTACKEFTQAYQHNGQTFYGAMGGPPLTVSFADREVRARVVRLAIDGRCSLALDEVEVYAADDPKKNIALGQPADQISLSPYSIKGSMTKEQIAGVFKGRLPNASAVSSVGATTPAAKPTTPSEIEVALATTRKLADRLHGSADTKLLEPLLAELANIEKTVAAGTADAELGEQLTALRRRIAFTNPKLQAIDRLLFITRHEAGGPFHMCDQYYGCNAKPGGRLYVLEGPFGDEPRLIDLLEGSVVQNGRLKGQKLEGGSFLSPEVSYDGSTVYFAWSQCQATQTYTWAPEFSYHLFRCDADGGNLRQLTDGEADDFDPCELPGGRIAFTTLRRGGYLRCGRHCPVYTIYSMEPDGSDIQYLSYHETHEWHPSVSNDGMLVYTRWDYVDRDTNVAHHIWLSYPDGRDPRSYHGNYPVSRNSRPWMEMSIRAIPGSHKFVATAAAHHGHAYGSLVLIDQRIEDDNAMSQLECLTPDVAFPEASGRGSIKSMQQFATPWPLSEDDYICVYDPAARNHAIYWIDKDGNREKIFSDPSVPCLSPIPLAARTRPPIIPDQTTQTAAAVKRAGGTIPTATIALMNVYDSDFDWPEGTKIERLRIVQVLPKTTPPPNQPRIGIANQTNARSILGSVPVESDGSAYFEAPVGCPIYFQALDKDGMAIQSMRSATYVHPGEQLTCQGCHERKHSPVSGVGAQMRNRTLPLAMRRGASTIEPYMDGTCPFNYPRLVQGVLDRNCVECHQKEKTLDLSGGVDGAFTRSYNNLARKYGFFYNVGNGSINDRPWGGSRTPAGRFGAKEAPLLKYLDESHHGVKLSQEDRMRMILWLDANSEFLGAYENEAAQRKGELVHPSLH